MADELFPKALTAAKVASHIPLQDQVIAQWQLDRVIEYLVPDVPDITLKTLASAELTDMGVMGYAAINSDTVGQAFQYLMRYHELTSDRFRDHMEVDDEWVTIRPIPLAGFLFDQRTIAEDCFAGNWRTLTSLLGEAFNYESASVEFDYPEPEYGSSYRELFVCDIRFESEVTQMRFPASWMAMPVATANATMASVCKAMCERLLGSGDQAEDMPQIVRRLLLSRPGRRMYRLEEAAAVLQVSPSQLRKRLYKAGTSYKTWFLRSVCSWHAII